MSTDRDTYWAAEKDPEDLASECWDRARSHFDGFQTSHFWAKALRNWLYFYNLYYGNRGGWSWSAVEQISDGDVLAVAINEFRAIGADIYNLITKNRPGFDVRGTNPSDQSLQDARYGEEVLENYLHTGLEKCFTNSALHALIFTSGYVYTPWDESGGEIHIEPQTVNPQTLMIEKGIATRNGDFDPQNPTVFDIAYDPGVRAWERNRWILIRSYENRWELAAQAGTKRIREAVLDHTEGLEYVEDQVFLRAIRGMEQTSANSDIIPVWNFYHLPTDALETGRHFRFLSSAEPLGDPEDFTNYKLPISRVTPGEIAMSQLGYSPLNDLQAPQEMLNAEMSSIATNHHGASHNVIWVPEDANLDTSLMNDGVIAIQGGQHRPAGIDFNADNPGRERYLKRIDNQMERLSGMNSAHRGQPEASLKSGEALKVMDAKAIESTSTFGQSYDRCIEEVGTYMLRTLRDKMGEGEVRKFNTKGANGRFETRSFTKKHLESIDGITVNRGNPLTQAISGRLAIGDKLIELGAITDSREYIELLDTGNLEEVMASKTAQIDLVKDENEALRRGEDIPAADAYGDDHVYHIKEHLALIASLDARKDEEFALSVMAHVKTHQEPLKLPDVAWVQVINGYGAVPPPPSLGPAPPPEAGGGQPGGPPPNQPAEAV